MRVLVVSTSYPCSPGDASGHFVRAAALEHVAAGHDVHVVGAGGARAIGPYADRGLTVHLAGAGGLFDWPGAAVRARRAPWRLWQLATFARSVREVGRRLGTIDLVEAHWLVPSGWPTVACSGLPAHRLRLCAHGADVRTLLQVPSAMRSRLVRRWLSARAEMRFSSRSLRDALAQSLPRGLAATLRAAAVVRMPALELPSTDRLAQLSIRYAEPLRPGRDGTLVASMGRLVPSKGFEMAVDALGRLRGRARWVVVGDGPLREPLERQCRAMGVAARFLGRRPRDEALAILSAADVLLHPSTTEAAPCVVREARALGVPVVACDAGDVAEWARADPGIVVSPPSPVALARAVDRLACADSPARTRHNVDECAPRGDPGLLPGPLPGHASPLDRVPSGSEA